MLVFIAYAASLLATVAGAVMLFQTVVGVGHADRTALAAVQARTAQASAPISKPAVSSVSKVVEPSKADKSERIEAPKRKRVTQSRPKPRVGPRRPDYHYNYPGYYGYGQW